MKMKENKLVELSMEFAVLLLDFVKNNKIANKVITNQITRSGTSVGANIHEAQYAHGKVDFVAKLEISLKEANETSYWLELLNKTNSIDAIDYKNLSRLCGNIRRLLIASCKTVKENK